MLESLPARNTQEAVVRFQRRRRDDDFLRDQDLDPLQIMEMKEFLESRGIPDSLDDLVDGLFKPKPRLWKTANRASRYSDGSFPVGYFSLEADTAKQRFSIGFPQRSRANRVALERRGTQGLAATFRAM